MKKSTDATDKGNTPAKPGVKKPAPKRSTSKPRAAKPPKKPHGRPSAYTPAIAEEICRRIAAGESLRSICKDEHLPHEATVRGWALDDHDGFFTHYDRAVKIRAMHWAEEILEISDDGTNDWMEKHDKDGMSVGYVINGEHVSRSKLRTDNRKWLLAKVLPKVYGDNLNVNHGTQPGDPLAKLYEQMAGTPLRPASEDGDK